jgi:hypothetical protein
MPVNFEKVKQQYQDDYKGSSLDQAKAARDTLFNYPKIVETILAKSSAQPQQAPQQPAVTAPTGASNQPAKGSE